MTRLPLTEQLDSWTAGDPRVNFLNKGSFALAP